MVCMFLEWIRAGQHVEKIWRKNKSGYKRRARRFVQYEHLGTRKKNGQKFVVKEISESSKFKMAIVGYKVKALHYSSCNINNVGSLLCVGHPR